MLAVPGLLVVPNPGVWVQCARETKLILKILARDCEIHTSYLDKMTIVAPPIMQKRFLNLWMTSAENGDLRAKNFTFLLIM